MDKLEQANENIKELIDQIIFYEHHVGSMSEGRCERFDYSENDCNDCDKCKEVYFERQKQIYLERYIVK